MIRIKPATNIRRLTCWHLCLMIALAAAYYLPTHWAAMVSTFCNFLWMIED